MDLLVTFHGSQIKNWNPYNDLRCLSDLAPYFPSCFPTHPSPQPLPCSSHTSVGHLTAPWIHSHDPRSVTCSCLSFCLEYWPTYPLSPFPSPSILSWISASQCASPDSPGLWSASCLTHRTPWYPCPTLLFFSCNIDPPKTLPTGSHFYSCYSLTFPKQLEKCMKYTTCSVKHLLNGWMGKWNLLTYILKWSSLNLIFFPSNKSDGLSFFQIFSNSNHITCFTIKGQQLQLIWSSWGDQVRGNGVRQKITRSTSSHSCGVGRQESHGNTRQPRDLQLWALY